MTKTVLTTLAIVGALGRAAYGQSLGLTPAEVRVAFKPQEVVQFELSVSNDGDVAVPMRASVKDLWYDAKTNEKLFGEPGTLPNSAANWVTFVPPTFVVPPHGTGKVKVVVTPPPDAAGGSYAVLFVESKPELAQGTPSNGKPIYANLRLGALILLTAAGTEQFHIDVTNTKVTPPAGNKNLEVAFDVTNGSNTHVFPEPRVTVLNGDRQVVARAQADTRRFFPGQKDSMKVSWAGTLPPGAYTAVLTVTYGDRIYTDTLPFQVDPPSPGTP